MSPSHGVTTVHRSRNQGDTGGMSPPPPPPPPNISPFMVSRVQRGISFGLVRGKTERGREGGEGEREKRLSYTVPPA